jgi:STE24 endopeptidase
MQRPEQFYEYDGEKRILAKKYENVRLVLDVIGGTIVPLGICVLLVFSGASVLLGGSLEGFSGSYWLTVLGFLLVFILTLGLVASPFSFYAGYVVDHRFGLSTQSVKDWLTDELKGLGLELAIGVLAGLLLYYLILSTTLWWLVAAALFAIFSILLSIILPDVIMPIFYKVTPLTDQTLKDDLLEMSRKMGARNIDRVLVADESRKSIRANAMFSGIGKSKTIVLFDTLLDKFTRREVVTVVAHELGHYVNKDIWKEALTSGLLAIPPFFLADFALSQTAGNFGISGPADPAGVPIIFAVLIGVNFILQPISNSYSRNVERQADQFALRAADDADAQASAEKRLADLSLAVDKPNAAVEFFFYTHPPSSRRVKLAEDWKKTKQA